MPQFLNKRLAARQSIDRITNSNQSKLTVPEIIETLKARIVKEQVSYKGMLDTMTDASQHDPMRLSAMLICKETIDYCQENIEVLLMEKL